MRKSRNELAYPPSEYLDPDPQDVIDDLRKARAIVDECALSVTQ
jgi:hypothetical protein